MIIERLVYFDLKGNLIYSFNDYLNNLKNVYSHNKKIEESDNVKKTIKKKTDEVSVIECIIKGIDEVNANEKETERVSMIWYVNDEEIEIVSKDNGIRKTYNLKQVSNTKKERIITGVKSYCDVEDILFVKKVI